MTAITAGIAAESAILRQNIALSVIKQSNDQAQALVSILDEASRSIPTGSRGGSVNITA